MCPEASCEEPIVWSSLSMVLLYLVERETLREDRFLASKLFRESQETLLAWVFQALSTPAIIF